MKVFTKISMAATLITFGALGFTGITMAATTPSLGMATSYGALSTTLTVTSSFVTINGSIGYSTLSSIYPLGVHLYSGSLAPFSTAGSDQATALTALGAGANASCTFAFSGGAIDLAADTTHGPIGVYTPGVYCTTTSDGAMSIGTTGIILSGAGTYIFRTSGPTNAFTTVAGSSVTLTNGASACDVFWTPTAATTLAATTTFIGTVIDDAGITVYDSITWTGRALSFASTVVFPGGGNTSTITVPTCAVPVVTGGTARIARLIPLINILKVPTPLVLVGSGLVTYNYTVQNIGPNLALRNITVNDDTCGPVVYISGDVNHDGRLELTEKWYYRCITTLSATTTNIVTVYGESDDSYRDVATDTATAIVVVTTGATITGLLTPPLINIVKIPDRLTPFTVGGGDVTYTYTVTNPGIVAMHDVVVTDDKCSPVSLIRGDINHDHLLDVNETWIYTCASHISASTKNTATAKGVANGFTVYDYAFANVYVIPGLPKTGLTGTTPWNIIILAGILMIVSTSLIVASKRRTI